MRNGRAGRLSVDAVSKAILDVGSVLRVGMSYSFRNRFNRLPGPRPDTPGINQHDLSAIKLKGSHWVGLPVRPGRFHTILSFEILSVVSASELSSVGTAIQPVFFLTTLSFPREISSGVSGS